MFVAWVGLFAVTWIDKMLMAVLYIISNHLAIRAGNFRCLLPKWSWKMWRRFFLCFSFVCYRQLLTGRTTGWLNLLDLMLRWWWCLFWLGGLMTLVLKIVFQWSNNFPGWRSNYSMKTLPWFITSQRKKQKLQGVSFYSTIALPCIRLQWLFTSLREKQKNIYWRKILVRLPYKNTVASACRIMNIEAIVENLFAFFLFWLVFFFLWRYSIFVCFWFLLIFHNP